ncbi:MAG: SpoIIE family protein phosphatase, partial [Deltaproteobacteria bacterium]|nr:SpoIIE family protein phosphatase [Deltaproteobacteria bacterium]
MPKKEPLEIIHLLSRAISQAAKLEEVYDIMLDELVNTFGVERASIMHFQPKSKTLKIVAARGMDPEIWKNISIPVGEGASGAAFSKAKPVLIEKKKMSPKYKTHSYMIAPVLSFPMKVGKTPIGVINVTDKKSREPFTQSDLKLLTILSDQVAAYMHLCDLLERVKSGERAKMQLEMAHTIQQRLLPATPPNIKGIDVTGFLLPAQKVGADYYDFFSIDGKNLELCIADVSGHDVSSALLAFALRSCIHSESLHNETPAALVTAMNKLLFNDLLKAEQFISLVYAKFQPQTKILTYTNAGHNPPLLWKAREKKAEW